MTTRSQQAATITESRGHYYGASYGTTSVTPVAATVTAAQVEEKHPISGHMAATSEKDYQVVLPNVNCFKL